MSTRTHFSQFKIELVQTGVTLGEYNGHAKPQYPVEYFISFVEKAQLYYDICPND